MSSDIGPGTFLWKFDIASGSRRRLAHSLDLAGPDGKPSYEWRIEGPVWSPDGKRIAFWAWDDENEESEAVFVTTVYNGAVSRIVVDGARPTWSPDGKQIAFDRSRAGVRQIFAVDRDGTNDRQLSHGQRDSWSPRWRRGR